MVRLLVDFSMEAMLKGDTQPVVHSSSTMVIRVHERHGSFEFLCHNFLHAVCSLAGESSSFPLNPIVIPLTEFLWMGKISATSAKER